MDRTLVSIPGYQVSQEIYNSYKTLVYRGYREIDQKPVVLKLLKNPYPSFSQLVQFRNQYTIAKNLNSPLIIQIYSLEPYKNGYVMVMEDFEGIPLSQWKGRGGTVATLMEFCQIAIALCNTLDFLYRHRIIHKDIKPTNILINSATKQTKLIDFSIATLIPRETQTLINHNVLEGTLSYLSPEQTGRMNRGIDYRTDFYSLGVTFYELLTGKLPFLSLDPMELIHSHIAKLPPLVHEINPDIPPVFSDIVSTLMAKNAEERYQSALGLRYDLENCWEQLNRTGTITDFQIRQRDVCVGVACRRHRFIISEQLYGREKEVETLLTAFERVSAGSTEMMLVAGFSGIGKTAIINEVHKPIVRQGGYFIKGKFDQFNRNIPLSAFVSALQDLISQLLSESDFQIKQWKNKILSALGENGQVIIKVIPELEQIIGSQPDVPELSGNAAQNRFNFLFKKFIATFTIKEHPLVIFLDDLHSCDSGSLKLMQLLISKTSPGYLLLIGAYRDNEVSPIHPLILTLNEMEKTGATLNMISLAPLNQSNINQLIADTLSCSPELALALTKLVYQKTQGNPFFNNQFLKVLHEEGRITFNIEVGHWQCDIAQINALALTDNVVEFMAIQLQTNHRSAVFYLYYNKTVLCYLLEQYHQAADYIDVANSHEDSAKPMFVGTLFCFYTSLVYLALYKSATVPEQFQYLKKVVANQEKFKEWSNHCPTNHLHKFYLVEAEKHRVLGNKAEAIEYYDRAICGAKENSFIHEVALANELAAKFYLEWGKEKIAQFYMTEAYYAYSHWGTKAKVDDLEQRYPQLLASIFQQRQQSFNLTEIIFAASSTTTNQASTLSNNYISKTLDFASIFKASQTLAGEIELEKLVSTLLQVVLENAGADKCVLLLPKDEQWVIQAIAQLGQPLTFLSLMAKQLSQYVPTSLINFVKRTLKPAVIFNAVDDNLVALDPYILRQSPKSVLCTPILNQGKLIGILYLENSLMSGVFTSERLEVLNFLCAQAAISLENARVYQQAQNYAQQLELSLDALRASESRFQMLADNIPGIIFQLRSTEDYSLSMRYISSGCYDLYEVTPEVLMSGAKSVRSFEHPDDIPEIDRARLYSAQNLTPFRAESRIITPSGKVKWIQVVSQPEQQDDGAVIWNGVILDISDRKHAEAERQKKTEELETALKKLQQAQIQLVQNEKMSALGNLLAGVAHEINNPVGFLSGNIQPALEYIEDIFGLVDLYQQKYPNPDAEIKKKILAIDLDYIREDLPKLIGSMLEGVNRICDISSTLRTFSRRDSDHPVATNIHDGIDSTILILRHRLKASGNHPEIKVLKEYGSLPLVECFAGQLNQVFMNLLANAIDALEESNTGRSFAELQAHPNYITITTKMSDDQKQAIISIKDNGSGMTEEVQQLIFDDFFTTKTVKKGTGLGLAIARKIIAEKHGGNIDVDSKIGQGTQFTIKLPISHSSSSPARNDNRS